MITAIKDTASKCKCRIYTYLKIIVVIISKCGIFCIFKYLTDYYIIRNAVKGKLSFIIKKYQIENPEISFYKYLDINYWVFENLHRFYILGLHKSNEKIKILDLGTGTGYFPFVCKFYGHEVEALDISNNEMYNDIIKKLEIKRYDGCICAFKRLEIDKRYDLITSFMICYNNHKNPGLWHIEEWEFFLNSLYNNNLNARGEILLSFNAETPEEPISDELVSYFSANNAEIDGTTVHIKNNYNFKSTA